MTRFTTATIFVLSVMSVLPAQALGVPVSFPTLSFPTSAPVSDRGCASPATGAVCAPAKPGK